MFKIGVGPSSSHTMGPWVAAAQFAEFLRPFHHAPENISIHLYGSLAKTGRGHGTDIAVQLGIQGFDVQTMDVQQIPAEIQRISTQHFIHVAEWQISFDPKRDIVFHMDQQLPAHPNGMRIVATMPDGNEQSRRYYSVGGGFVVGDEPSEGNPARRTPPMPISSAADLIRWCDETDSSISTVVMRNEANWEEAKRIDARLDKIRDTMLHCVHHGLIQRGTLPGGLNVQRRAAETADALLGSPIPTDFDHWMAGIRSHHRDRFEDTMDWVSCFALAVNEENANFGRVVTAPTNGAAGVIPAVLMYRLFLCDSAPNADTFDDLARRFLMTASEIGAIFKKGSTISAAMGGCQAEIGVSSAMAAAALVESHGGSPRRCVEAAEVAMEHHLGLTCDPIGGLVQIPCIERNAFGAIKSIMAARMALRRKTQTAIVSLDHVVQTMWQTAQDMDARYKETSEGGLATQIAVNVSEC
ncbi:MAG: L-serine ammonia-lyase [Planctomycetota bacterium]